MYVDEDDIKNKTKFTPSESPQSSIHEGRKNDDDDDSYCDYYDDDDEFDDDEDDDDDDDDVSKNIDMTLFIDSP